MVFGKSRCLTYLYGPTPCRDRGNTDSRVSQSKSLINNFRKNKKNILQGKLTFSLTKSMQSVPEWTYTIWETYYFLAFTSNFFGGNLFYCALQCSLRRWWAARRRWGLWQRNCLSGTGTRFLKDFSAGNSYRNNYLSSLRLLGSCRWGRVPVFGQGNRGCGGGWAGNGEGHEIQADLRGKKSKFLLWNLTKANWCFVCVTWQILLLQGQMVAVHPPAVVPLLSK